jgi:putative phosphoesterase
MRVGLVSDTHGYLDARVRDKLKRYGCDRVVHAGDVGSALVLAELRGLAPLSAVYGNNDVPGKWPTADREVLADLPQVVELRLPGGMLVVRHGDAFPTPAEKRHARLRAAHPDARAIVYGHSHALLRDTTDRPWILNPGAAGRERTKGGPSCLLLHATERRWRVTPVRFPRQSTSSATV